MKTKMPSEESVRRYFQSAYYNTLSYDKETGRTAYSNDTTNFIYPKGKRRGTKS